MAERSKALQLSCRGLAGVGSNPAGDIYFHFELFAPSPFRTGQRSRCKWNQACPFTWSHSCFRPQIWFIIQDLVYKYLQYSFKTPTKRSPHRFAVACLSTTGRCPMRSRSFLARSNVWDYHLTMKFNLSSIFSLHEKKISPGVQLSI